MRTTLEVRSRPARWLAMAFIVAAAACGNGAGDDTVLPTSTLVVTPATAVLEVVNGVPATQAFTVTMVELDGTMSDVTADVAWSVVDPAFGDFAGATFSARGGRGGKTYAQATLATLVGEAQIEVTVRGVRLADNVPSTVPGLFGSGTNDPATAPTMVYPPDQVIVPANLGDLEAHWTDGFGHDLYELSLLGDHVDLKVYVRAGATGWSAFTSDEWITAARSAPQLVLGLRALTEASPAVIGVAANRVVKLTNEDLIGGLYYWGTPISPGQNYGIFRHDFGDPGSAAEPFYTVNEAGRCVACHALSRDGTRMAVTYDGGNRSSTIVDVATQTAMIAPETMFWNFATYTPDGSRLITSHEGVLTVRDGANGNALGTVPAGGYGTHPDFAADGTQMVYVAAAAPRADWEFTGGTIAVIPYDAAAGFGTPRPIVNDGGNNYYPSFSPDGQWILFNRSAEDAYDDGTAELWVVKVDGTAAPRKLDLANLGVGLTNSWARWAPFVNSFGPTGSTENLYWLTFSSKRTFGVRLPGGQPQLWMAPFFPGRVETGGDPTAPAFRLPFQDIASNNHIAQWTETVVPIGKLVRTAAPEPAAR